MNYEISYETVFIKSRQRYNKNCIYTSYLELFFNILKIKYLKFHYSYTSFMLVYFFNTLVCVYQ
jgi:hypothetical protein